MDTTNLNDYKVASAKNTCDSTFSEVEPSGAVGATGLDNADGESNAVAVGSSGEIGNTDNLDCDVAQESVVCQHSVTVGSDDAVECVGDCSANTIVDGMADCSANSIVDGVVATTSILNFEPIVLYEDNHLLVVVKPQNLLSQADVTMDTDLLSILKSYVKQKYNKPGAVFLGLVHRLDRPTGGVMVFARTSKSAERLSQQLRDGDISKKYLAIVTGTPKLTTDRLVHYLKKDSTTNTVVQAPMSNEGAKKCILHYKVLESVGKFSLVDVKLVTGRSHQIRAQFKAIGHPLLGDVRYGGQKSRNLALWAYELRFEHPTTKRHMVFRVFPPEDTQFKNFNIDRYINIYRPE